jgi:hypothetical protein
MIHKKKLASRIFPIYSKLLEEVNNNAKVRKWIREHKKDTPIFQSKLDLYNHVNATVCNSSAIDYFEFGVYRGDSIRNWASINSHPDSRFFGFDSFEGLPETWNEENKAGTFDVGGRIPEIADPRVQFIKGWFQKTLRQEISRYTPLSRMVIHNDSDLYSSTIFVLTVLDPLIVPGTVLIFDEFSSPLHEFRAFHDYTNSYMRNFELLGMTADYASQVAFRFTG